VTSPYHYRGYWSSEEDRVDDRRRKRNGSRGASPLFVSMLLMIAVFSGFHILKHEILSPQASQQLAQGGGEGSLVIKEAKLEGEVLTITIKNPLDTPVSPNVVYIMSCKGEVEYSVMIKPVKLLPHDEVTLRLKVDKNLQPGLYMVEVVSKEMAKGIGNLVCTG